MFCPNEEQLSLWLDRRYSDEAGPGMDVHFAECDECRRGITLAYWIRQELPSPLSPEDETRVEVTVRRELESGRGCLSEDQLAAWLQDALPREDHGWATEHLSRCDECRRVASLTRLAKSDPLFALSPFQEQRTLELVLRRAEGEVRLTFWRVAAASIVIGIASAYLAVQWNTGPVGSAPVVARSQGRDHAALRIPSIPNPLSASGARGKALSSGEDLDPGAPIDEARSILLMRAVPGTAAQDDGWLHTAASRRAGAMEFADPPIPDAKAPIHWVDVKLAEPLRYRSGMYVSARYRTDSHYLYVWVDGFHGKVPADASGWTMGHWPLAGLRREGVLLEAGEPLKMFMIGVLQDGDQPRVLEVAAVEIRLSAE
ncbi:MAG: hypothetical protein HY716_03185 [Planctomycetes bacterium]|nr:hypothetical protein [Planctomycetota bacterium]